MRPILRLSALGEEMSVPLRQLLMMKKCMRLRLEILHVCTNKKDPLLKADLSHTDYLLLVIRP
jgi:hypothetical protein